MQKFIRSNFFIKLTTWEYWPFGVIQIPILILWIWYAIRERSLLYFTASNPSILTGGMMGESKYKVLEMVPASLKPKTILINLPFSVTKVTEIMRTAGLTFPLIFKPDLGERGWMVRKIKNEQDIHSYLLETRIDFIMQELIELPLEFSVFYVRFPSHQNGFVNSITGKKFLSVTGDGIKTLQELIIEKDRAKIQWEVLRLTYADRLPEIIPANKRVELVSIGNHCLGTTFLNYNHLINDKLNATFDSISKQIPGFYFGRYDLRCASEEDLENGNIKIMELNGCGAEPSHIYHPGSSVWKAMSVLITHWNNLYRISKENHERGVPYLSLQEGRKIYRKVKKVMSPGV